MWYKNLTDLFWPDLSIENAINKVARTGFWASIITSIIMLVIRAKYLFEPNIPHKLYFDLIFPALYLILAFGILKKSRIASLLTLILIVFDLTFAIAPFNNIGVAILTFAIIFSSTRGAFAFHKSKKAI